MRAGTEHQGTLRLVHSAEPFEQSIWFCGRCAETVEQDITPSPNMRVCRSCGLGLLLEARTDLVPKRSDAFLVVDWSLSTEALSAKAEKLLGITEVDTVHTPITELLVPASAEPTGQPDLARCIVDAVAGANEIRTLYLRPRNTFGVRLRARIGPCGPPRAALVVLDGSRPALRSV